MNMVNNGERINKITVKLEGNGVVMTCYRTHKKLITLTNADIQVPAYVESQGTNKPAYMEYCRSILINLLQNGGVQGYYYDPTNYSEQNQSGIPKKFDVKSFVSCAADIVEVKMESITGQLPNISHDIDDTGLPDVTECYSDGHIKYAKIDVIISVTNDTLVATVKCMVPVEIKSGQLTKPHIMRVMNGPRASTEMSLSATSITALFTEKPVIVQVAPVANNPVPPVNPQTYTEQVASIPLSTEIKPNITPNPIQSAPIVQSTPVVQQQPVNIPSPVVQPVNPIIRPVVINPNQGGANVGVISNPVNNLMDMIRDNQNNPNG